MLQKIRSYIKEEQYDFYINKSCTPPEVYCSLRFYEDDFKSAGVCGSEYGINVPKKIVRIMEESFVYNLHYETELFHVFIYIDRIKASIFHPVYECYCVRASDCVEISKNKFSNTYDINKLREYNMRYREISKIKNLTCSYSGVPKEVVQQVTEQKKEIKQAKKEQSKYTQGDLF